MRRAALTLWGLLVLAASGCGSIVPPEPPELSVTATPAAPAKTIAMVLAEGDTPDRSTWILIAREQAGSSRAMFRTLTPGSDEPPRRQAELIKALAVDGASVFIVEPNGAPEVAEVLEEVRARGMPVVLLGRSIPSRGKPFPYVAPSSFADSARRLVALAGRAAKGAGLSADGAAILLSERRPDAHAADSLAALRTALEAAGVQDCLVLDFDGTPDDAKKVLKAALEAHPEVTSIFGIESEGITGALETKDELKAKRVLVVSGYVGNASNLNSLATNQCAGIADRNSTAEAKQAVKVAVRLADRESVPERTEVPISVRPSVPEEAR